MNKCVFTGRLTKEPVYMAKTKDKMSFLAFTLAVTNGYGDTEKVMFIDCSANSSLADRLNSILYKGVKVIVDGQLYTYDSKYGENKIALNLKDCEIVTHTKAYLEKNKHIKKEIEERQNEIINEAVIYQYGDKREEMTGKGKAVDWDKIERELGYKDSKLSDLPTDEEGFMQIDEDDIGLPFD